MTAGLLPAGVAGASGHLEPAPISTIELVGHGSGPGIGMGQWGDFGYAVRYHFGYGRILNHFYGGTRPGSLALLHEPVNPTISVVMLENEDLANNVGYDPVVTSAAGFSVVGSAGPPGPPSATSTTTTSPAPSTTSTSSTSTTTTAPSATSTTTGNGASASSFAAVTTRSASAPGAATSRLGVSTGTLTPTATTAAGALQPIGGVTNPTPKPAGRRYAIPAGEAVDFRLQANGTWNAYVAGSCTAALHHRATARPLATNLVDPVASPKRTSPSAPLASLLTLCRHDGVDQRLRGSIEAYDRQGYERTINLVPLESYLEGVVPGEVSSSWGTDGTATGAPQHERWGFQALEAQAVAARSFEEAVAASGGWAGYADICDSIYCQAYVGAAYESHLSNLAVTDTTGQVRVSGSGAGRIATTNYSASTGGYTDGAQFPAVPDLGDACVVPGKPLECNPVHTWVVTVSAAQLTAALPRLGKLIGLGVTSRNDKGAFGGRARSVSLVGTARRVVESGNAVASALGLRSDWFAVAKVTRAASSTPTTTTTPVAAGTSGSTTTVPSTTLAPSTTTTTTPVAAGTSGSTTTVVSTTVPSTTLAPTTTTAGPSGSARRAGS